MPCVVCMQELIIFHKLYISIYFAVQEMFISGSLWYYYFDAITNVVKSTSNIQNTPQIRC